jgi:hypothetical protein
MSATQLASLAADAELNNAGMLTYTELLSIAQSLLGIAIWHTPSSDKTASADVERCRTALEPLADTLGRES